MRLCDSEREAIIPLSTRETRRGLRLMLWDAGLMSAMSRLPNVNVIMVGFALAMGASTFDIGLLTAIPMLAGLSQLWTNRILESQRSRKRVCLRTLLGARLMKLLAALLPWVPWAFVSDHRIWGLILIQAAVQALGSIGGISRISWLSDLVPESIRGRFFGNRNLVIDAVGIVVLMAGGRFIDVWQHSHPGAETGGFQIVIGLGVLFGMLSLLVMRITPEPPMRTNKNPIGFLRSLKVPLEDRAFRRFIAFQFSWSFAVGLAGPFFMVYMIQHLKIGYTWIGLYQNIGILASLYSVRFWGRWTDSFGNKPILTLCAGAKILFPLLWLFARPGHPLYLCFVYLLFAFNSGQKLALFNIVLKLSPEKNRAAYLSSRQAFIRLAQALSPMLGGCLAATLMTWKLELPFLTLRGLPFLFLASGLMRFGAFFILRGLHEPGAQPVRSMVRVLRRIDGFVPTDGLGSFVFFWSAPVRELSQAIWNGGKQLRQAIGSGGDKNGKEYGDGMKTGGGMER